MIFGVFGEFGDHLPVINSPLMYQTPLHRACHKDFSILAGDRTIPWQRCCAQRVSWHRRIQMCFFSCNLKGCSDSNSIQWPHKHTRWAPTNLLLVGAHLAPAMRLVAESTLNMSLPANGGYQLIVVIGKGFF